MAIIDKSKGFDPNILLKVGVAVGGYFLIVKPLLETLGLKKSTEDKNQDAENEASAKVLGWSPLFYHDVSKKGISAVYKKASAARAIAKEIYDAWGIFNDDEEQVNDAFNKLRNWVQLSQVAEAYSNLAQADLYSDLKARLSRSEFNVIARKVAAYEKYK